MLLAALAACAGAFVQSASGFGFALVLSPALFGVLEPVEAVATLLALGLALNLLVLFERGRPGPGSTDPDGVSTPDAFTRRRRLAREGPTLAPLLADASLGLRHANARQFRWIQAEHVDWGALAPMLVAALPGLGVGAVALTQLSKEVLQVAVGVAVVAAAAWQLHRRRRHERPRLRPAAGWAVGFASGALTTSISVSGPPIVLWLEARGVRPEEFRASLAASFLALNLAGGAVLLAAEGGVAVELGTVLPLLGLVLVGYAMGALAFRRIGHERFFALVLALVAATGAASIVAGLVG